MRIPAELKDRLDNASKAAGRSLTAEVVTRLTESLNGPAARDLTFPEIVAALTKVHAHTLDEGGVTITVEVKANDDRRHLPGHVAYAPAGEYDERIDGPQSTKSQGE